VISIRKLNSLPRKTRLRKLVLLIQAEERELELGRAPHREYLGGLCALLAGEQRIGRRLVDSAEQCRRLCLAPDADLISLRRCLNGVRHDLLRHLGAEPAEWDLLAPASEQLDASRRTVLPMRVYLEEIRSPFNVGAIFRSSEAFGVERLLLSPTTASPLHPRALKTARGAVSVMPWSFAEFSQIAREDGIFALELGGAPLDEFPFPERGIMLVGSEELGLSPQCLALAGKSAGRVSVPMAGAKRSLNVSVAVGIVLQAWCSRLMTRRSEPNAKAETKRTSVRNNATDEPSAP